MIEDIVVVLAYMVVGGLVGGCICYVLDMIDDIKEQVSQLIEWHNQDISDDNDCS